MTKTELVERVGSVTGFPNSDVRIFLDALLEVSRQELVTGGSVSLTPFGSFRPHARKARTWRHPKTKAIHDITAGFRIKFRPGKALLDRARQ